MPSIPPWEHHGLPPDLTPEHFRVAATVWAAHREQQCRRDVLVPIVGVWSGDNNLHGGTYDDTGRRRDDLARTKPMAALSTGYTVYPVIAVHDPSDVGSSDVRPLGLISVAGFIGSVWNKHATSWNRTITRGAHGEPRTLFVTTVTMHREDMWAYLPLRQAYHTDDD